MGAFSRASWPTFFLMLILCASTSRVACQNVPAFFIFGDSLVDVGNNNYIASLARANFYPNGIDYAGGATGRFCNGKTVLDFIGDLAGLPPPPAYLNPGTRGTNILKGVNYASGAGGILDSTGYNYIQRLSMNQQLKNFQNTINELFFLLPFTSTTLLNDALYAVVMGSNDYINNYLQNTGSPTKNVYTPDQYVQVLISTYSQQLTTLYNLGARKIAIANVGPLGCIPEQITMVSTDTLGTCVPSVNALVVGFNAALKNLVISLNAQLPGSKFVYANVYDSVLGLVNSPQASGFSVNNAGCCGLGRLNGQFPCLPTSNLCPDRSQYVFWDPFHPTEAANNILANNLWTGDLNTVYPVNVQTLVNS